MGALGAMPWARIMRSYLLALRIGTGLAFDAL